MRKGDLNNFYELINKELKEFNSLYPSDKHCLEAIFQFLFPNGQMFCRHCGKEITKRDFGARKAWCIHCKKITWVTANTPFHGARLLRVRFASIWLMERGLPLNSARLHQVLGVPLSTAWAILQATLAIMAKDMLEQFPVIHVGNFAEIICRRSKESLAKEHPRAEIEEAMEREAANRKTVGTENDIAQESLGSVQSQVPQESTLHSQNEEETASASPDNSSLDSTAENDSEPSREALILKALEAGRASFDILCSHTGMSSQQLSISLTLLEISGLVSRHSGDMYSINRIKFASSASLSDQLLMATNKCMSILKDHFQGISLKYLQNYLAFAWIHLDRRKWCAGNLFKTICRSRKLREQELFERVSPGLVAIFANS